MKAVLILIIWTWDLTPLWVNIIATIILGLAIILECVREYWRE